MANGIVVMKQMVYNNALGGTTTMPMSEESRKRKIKYDAERTARVSIRLAFRFQKATDMDVVNKIKSQSNKVDYIRRLVRADIEKNGK